MSARREAGPGAPPGGATPSATPPQWERGEFTISTDPARLDLAAIHAFLTDSYWARGIPFMERRVSDVYGPPPEVQAGG